MSKEQLKFNDLPRIMDWIKDPSNAGHLFIIEQTIKSVKADQFKIGTKVKFGKARGQWREGVVAKLGPKKAVVDVFGQKWRVPYDLMDVVSA